jgi:hypothetical protein
LAATPPCTSHYRRSSVSAGAKIWWYENRHTLLLSRLTREDTAHMPSSVERNGYCCECTTGNPASIHAFMLPSTL